MRILSASNKDLKKLVDGGEFREDLYYRLKVFTITIPPLRERVSEIGPLARAMASVAAVEIGLAAYDPDAIHHFVLSHEAAEDVFRTLATESLSDRLHNPGLEAQRADVIVGGCCVLVQIFRTFGFDECLVSESDILDGLAASLLDAG